MKSFYEYCRIMEQQGVDSPFGDSEKTITSQQATATPPTSQDQSKIQLKPIKPKWKMSKSEIIKLWQSLPNGLPIAMSPISAEHEGSTFSEDAIRITGSTDFIKSVLSRLKEFLSYESDKTKLNISFRETSSPSLEQEGLAKTSYVFYLQTKERG